MDTLLIKDNELCIELCEYGAFEPNPRKSCATIFIVLFSRLKCSFSQHSTLLVELQRIEKKTVAIIIICNSSGIIRLNGSKCVFSLFQSISVVSINRNHATKISYNCIKCERESRFTKIYVVYTLNFAF